MRIDNALRLARCARGIAHADGVIFIDVGIFRIGAATPQEKFIVFVALRYRLATERNNDHAFEVYAMPDLFVEREQNIVDDENAVLGVVDYIRQLIGVKTEVKRVENASDYGNRKICFEMGIVIPHQ